MYGAVTMEGFTLSNVNIGYLSNYESVSPRLASINVSYNGISTNTELATHLIGGALTSFHVKQELLSGVTPISITVGSHMNIIQQFQSKPTRLFESIFC